MAVEAQAPTRTERAVPRSSIVIPVRDQMQLTRSCLNALLRQDRSDAEIIVVDDGSSAEQAAALGAYAPQVQIVRPGTGAGFAAACNAGAAVARGENVVLLNNDVLPLAGWLESLERFAAEHPRAGIVGSRLVWPDRTIQSAGVAVASDGTLRQLYAGWPADHPVVCRSRRLQIVPGAAMLVRREAWEALGGLDEGFHNSFEDVDLCLRAGQLGYELHLCGDSVVMHLESATRGSMPLGDEENFRRLVERWGRLEPDDLAIYAADGLVRTRHLPGRIEIAVDPAVGEPVWSDPSAVDQLLATRAHQVHELRSEMLRLRAQAADPWSGVRTAEPPPKQATVVIAVSDHGDLGGVLDALEAQTAGEDAFEVIVANSGIALPLEAAAALARPRRIPVRAVDAAGGRAAAWNRGIAVATGELTILLSDDFLPAPELVEQHLRCHQRDPAPELVGIGPSRFPDTIRADPFARWIEDSGHLFGVSFPTLIDQLPEGWFYCANTSAKRSFLLEAGGFDERFRDDCCDDAELGRRLLARGMRTAYLPGALAIHEHPLTLRERQDALRRAGRAHVIHDEIYPAPHPWNTGDRGRSFPSRSSVCTARLRAAVSRQAADRERWYGLVLERTRLRAYRREARRRTG
jgi:GT2 family glycosyltransferase